MKIEQRSFSGKSFRPKPLVEVDDQTQTLMVLTSWGSSSHAERVRDLMRDFLSLTREPDSTRNFEYIESLGPTANRLKSAAHLGNQSLFMNENRTEYSAAVEMAVVTVEKGTLHWVQIGSPHLILESPHGLQPLQYSPDWSWQIQQDAPLVSQALGLEKTCHFNCGSYHLQGGEALYLISRSHLPSKIFALSEPSLESMAKVLSDDNSETPFWMSRYSI